MEKPIEIIGQCSNLKNLAASGGWRFSIDLYDSRPQDIAMAALLVNKRDNVRITIEPIEAEKPPQTPVSQKRRRPGAEREVER
jgi:hypothetical protein